MVITGTNYVYTVYDIVCLSIVLCFTYFLYFFIFIIGSKSLSCKYSMGQKRSSRVRL